MTPTDKNRERAERILVADFPTAWRVARSIRPTLHHESCSFRVSEGGVLCDCAGEKSLIESFKIAREVLAQALDSKDLEHSLLIAEAVQKQKKACGCQKCLDSL